MSNIKMTWAGRQLTQEVRGLLVQRLHLCGELLASEVRNNLSEGSPPHSAPGEFPHSDSGRLRNAVEYEIDEQQLKLRVHVPVEYARYLEFGTANMDARPFLLRTFREMKPRLRQILLLPHK